MRRSLKRHMKVQYESHVWRYSVVRVVMLKKAFCIRQSLIKIVKNRKDRPVTL